LSSRTRVQHAASRREVRSAGFREYRRDHRDFGQGRHAIGLNSIAVASEQFFPTPFRTPRRVKCCRVRYGACFSLVSLLRAWPRVHCPPLAISLSAVIVSVARLSHQKPPARFRNSAEETAKYHRGHYTVSARNHPGTPWSGVRTPTIPSGDRLIIYLWSAVAARTMWCRRQIADYAQDTGWVTREIFEICVWNV